MRGRLWGQGVDPDSLPLIGWLDAGEVMLREGMDALWQQLLTAAFTADSREAIDLAFAALTAESEYRRKVHDEQQAKQRAADGAPAHFRSVSAEAMEAALLDVASWAGVPQPDPDEAGE